MARARWRPVVCAGVLVAGLLAGGPGVSPASAEPGRSDGGKRHTSDSGKRGDDRPGQRRGGRGDRSDAAPRGRRADRDTGFGRRGGAHDRPDARDGRAPDVIDERPTEKARDPGRFEPPPRRAPTISIPMLRVPAAAAERRGACGFGACVTTVDVPVPTLGLFRAEPEPEPPPVGPTFRGGPEEEPSVVDAATGGGGSRRPSAPEVLQMPAVVAPPRITGVRVGSAAATAPAPPAATPAPVALAGGAPVPPATVGSAPVAAPVGPAVPAAGPPGGPATRRGVPAYPRPGSTAREIVGALPGLLGLLLVTLVGGFIGYRQASAGRYVRAEGADRFLE